ncbi:MAG: prepilin peptidase [Candidatus Aegiribacteria sp.]|nr:prepilin peptidase [Candidatus Aegiribacteria sp.]
METVQLIYALILGMTIGSFLNVVACRVPRDESIIRPGSRCTSCGSAIRWYDNIPVLSWFILKGRCRSCGSRFSIRYAMVELLTGLLFAGVFLKFGVTWLFIKNAVFVSLLICAVLTDIDHWIILDSVSLGGIATGLAFSLMPGGVGLLPSLLSAAGAFLLFFLIRIVSELILKRKPGYTLAPEGHEDEADEFQGGMGWGDIKLAGMIGAFLGPSSAAIALFIAFLAGALTGITAMIAGRNRRLPIPFGPFLALGAAVAVFAGQAMWQFYLTAGYNL